LSVQAFARRSSGAAIVSLAGETMGTSWSARVVEPPQGLRAALEERIAAVLDRVVAQMSHWEPESEISRFNRSTPGTWQRLPPEFCRVLSASLDVAVRSGGAFDPAMGELVDLWGFGPSGPRSGMPTDAEVENASASAGRKHLELDELLLRARRTGRLSLDLSGIAKGYAVDAVADHLHALGLQDFLIEIGGELRGEGIKPDGQPWWVDVEVVPGASLPLTRAALHGLAVATSGDYRRHFEQDGRRYAHTLDPRTGRPLDNGVASVTVLHARCMLADAWATALAVLGPDQGLAVAAGEGLAMHMVVRDDDRFLEHLSPSFEAMLA
jgi:FAD:protein FMN transferase